MIHPLFAATAALSLAACNVSIGSEDRDVGGSTTRQYQLDE